AFARGEYAEAVRAFSDATRYARDQESREAATYWEAEALWKLRRFADAAWAFREVATSARTPTTWLHYGLGWAAVGAGSFDEAATRELQRFVASAHDQVLPSAHVHLAWSLLAAGRSVEALPSLRTAAAESTGAEKTWATAALARALRAAARNDELLGLARAT